MKKQQRLYFIVFVVACVVGAVAMSLYALRDNVSFYYSPTQLEELYFAKAPAVAPGKVFRLGGIVEPDSINRQKDAAGRILFRVSDMTTNWAVLYTGVLPDLFREGQGVVAKGALAENGIFIAEELLARHDENYMPPEVQASLPVETTPPPVTE